MSRLWAPVGTPSHGRMSFDSDSDWRWWGGKGGKVTANYTVRSSLSLKGSRYGLRLLPVVAAQATVIGTKERTPGAAASRLGGC